MVWVGVLGFLKMLIPKFMPITCSQGHETAFYESKCKTCGEEFKNQEYKIKNFCYKCGIMRPIIFDTDKTEPQYEESKFCFWCGNDFSIDPLNPI